MPGIEQNVPLRRPLESTQYASETYRKALDEAGLRGSMSAIANPYHNAQAESFMNT
jgi:transposase InsO family protein